MKFEWDPNKAEANLRKHRISFETGQLVFKDPLALSIPDGKHSGKEERWITLGRADGVNPLILVCHVYRDDDDEEVIRIISARKATVKEKQQYINLPRYIP